MKRKGFSKKPVAFILSIIMMLSMSMPAFAATAPFGTAGSGTNPFNPRGYSIMEDVNGDGTNENVWLQSSYVHNVLAGNVYGAAWSDTQTGQYYVTSGDKQMDAWVDKGQLTTGYNMPYQRSFTSDPNVDVRYFFAVSINDGPFVSVPYAEAAAKNLVDSNGNIDAAQGLSAFGYAARNVTDPDGITNQWTYPLTFTLKPGTKYTFAYLRGLVANNGISLILSKDTTADGQSGYTGVLQGPTLTDAEKAEWAAHCQDIYQYPKTLTPLGTGVSTGSTVNSVEFKDFYSTLQTYADLTALNSLVTEATSFANGVTDADYEAGNYRKSSVDALKTLITEINAKTDLKEEVQTSVDALTSKLSDALNYAKEPAILVKGITLDKNSADMTVGDTLTLKATISPDNADDPTVTWTSSNDQVATVENGVVKAVSAGNATITAKTVDGGYTADCTINAAGDTTAPVVSGIVNNSIYNSDETITFNEGTATLDGNTFYSGGTVSKDGRHTLVAVDAAGNTTTLKFVIDKSSPVVTVKTVKNEIIKSGGVSGCDVAVSIFDLSSVTKSVTLNGKACAWSANGRFTKDGRYVITAKDQYGRTTQITFTIQRTGVTYSAYIQSIAWQKPVSNGKAAGTTNRQLRIEALKIKLTGSLPKNASINYQAYVHGKGWVSGKNGTIAGITGKKLQIEAVRITVSGLNGYTVKYKAYVQKKGWGNFVQTKNGTSIASAAVAGKAGSSLRVESIEIQII